MAMECTIRAGAVAIALTLAWMASAATRTASFQVTAQIHASCLINAPSSFDTMRAAARSTGRVQVVCSSPVPHAVSTVAPTPTVRRLLVLVTY